jgi:aminoglycoside phosphotransferase (APT) family kinase protein
MATDATDLVGPGGATRRLVLRRWLRPGWESDPAFTAVREAAILERLAGSGLPVASVVAVDADGFGTGAPALLLTRLEGRPPSPALERRPVAISAMAERLVQVHAADDRLRTVAVPFAPYVELAQIRPPASTHRPALWTRALAVAAEEPPAGRGGFLHRDYHPGNTLWTGVRLTGIVDWTNASWGPPGVDVAHWRANLGTRHGIAVADTALAAYRDAGGELAEQAWWDVRILLDFIELPLDEPEAVERVEDYLAALLARV